MFIDLTRHFPRQLSSIEHPALTAVRLDIHASSLPVGNTVQISPGARETRARNKMSNSTEMSTYEFANPTFAESTLAKFEDLKPCRINTYIKTRRGHGPVETPKGKVVRVSADGPLRGAGLSVFVAQVAARGLCAPRPEAFRSVSSHPIRPASIAHR